MKVPTKNLNGASDLFQGKTPSLWKFWKDGVTSSFFEKFVQCKEQTKLHYVDGWSGRNIPIGIEFGSCCHWVLEQAYQRRDHVAVLLEHPVDRLGQQVKEWVSQYEKYWRQEVRVPSSAQLSTQELIYGLAEVIIPEYVKCYAGDFTGEYAQGLNVYPKEWLSLEEVFMVPYVYPDGKTVPVRGRCDGIFKDKNSGIWVFDTKCRSVIQEDILVKEMPFDPQFMLYSWVGKQRYKTTPKGIVQNIIRRPQQRLSGYTSLKSMLERVRDEVRRRPQYYFIRIDLSFSPQEMTDWENRVLHPMMQEVREWWEGKPYYYNGRALSSKYGPCELFAAITSGNFSMCYKREYAFSELKDL
jgi:hypothetical protein